MAEMKSQVMVPLLLVLTLFSGASATFHPSETTVPEGICLEKIDNGTLSFTNMAPHPDNSDKIFLATQTGQILLAEMPNGLGQPISINYSSVFLNLTDRVYVDFEFGLMSFTFHPNFLNNGRFFVSYNCDSTKTPDCTGKCSCNSEIGCDPTTLAPDQGELVNTTGSVPCRYFAIVAEYTVNGTSSSPSTATYAVPTEVKRIFAMGLPYVGHHAGEIFFGPTDGYLYFLMGDGGSKGDPYNFAQNKKSVLGKALRINVDVMPTPTEVSSLGLWGNYTIPSDNPVSTDSGFRPEVWALGFRNPWRCNYDADRSSYLFCCETGEVGENHFDEVNLLAKGGNYGWRVYEGYELYNATFTPGGSTSPSSITPTFPILGYHHSEVHNPFNLAALVAGFVYRATTDPCLYGRFLYADLYAYDMWTAIETPYGSGSFTTTRTNFTCSNASPIACSFVGSTTLPNMGLIFSFGQDNNKDIIYLTSTGVYRIVNGVHCGYKCKSK
ncbi:hypothetical protein LUZ60_009259 [Juncus effusus]|nr:hypothetical protein LUZ60_009259 [Juncus effusus]